MNEPPWLSDALAGVREMGARLPHALLISGPRGWGGEYVVNALALDLMHLESSRDARRVAHPDLRWLQPEGGVIKVDAIRGDSRVPRPDPPGGGAQDRGRRGCRPNEPQCGQRPAQIPGGTAPGELHRAVDKRTRTTAAHGPESVPEDPRQARRERRSAGLATGGRRGPRAGRFLGRRVRGGTLGHRAGGGEGSATPVEFACKGCTLSDGCPDDRGCPSRRGSGRSSRTVGCESRTGW